MKKVWGTPRRKYGEPPRSFRYDLNQILYAGEMTNRFKKLDLTDTVPEELWVELHNIV